MSTATHPLDLAAQIIIMASHLLFCACLNPSWNSLELLVVYFFLLALYYLHILWFIPLTLPSPSYTMAPYVLGFVIAHIYLTQK